MTWTQEQKRQRMAEARRQAEQGIPALPEQEKAVDAYLSNLDSLITALEQRELQPYQQEWLARLLQRGERYVLMEPRQPDRLLTRPPGRVDP